MNKLQLAQYIVDQLNEIYSHDPEALHALCESRVPCNEALRKHPTVQVLVEGGGTESRVGLLGILNGIVGIQDDGWGYISAIYDEDTMKLQGFNVLVGPSKVDNSEP